MNLDHYRLNADFKHGVHFTALPTATEESLDETATEQATVELNSDFSTKGLSAQEIQSIVAAW